MDPCREHCRPVDWQRGALQADQALYQAKAAGRNGVRPFVAPLAA